MASKSAVCIAVRALGGVGVLSKGAPPSVIFGTARARGEGKKPDRASTRAVERVVETLLDAALEMPLGRFTPGAVGLRGPFGLAPGPRDLDCTLNNV